MNPLKEQAKLNRDIVTKASDELGIPEEKIPVLVEKMLQNDKSREMLFKALGEFVGRRSFLGGLAGIGAGLALTGLAGAKTVISDNNVIIDDQWYLKAPAPFSALVGIDGAKVIAYDWKGKVIAEGTAGVDDATVIQSVVTELGEGKIFITKGTYKITQKITCSGGIFFESEGAELDLTTLDDVAFEFNSDTNLVYDKLTGMKGFKVTASSANLNTLLVKASQIIRGFVLEKIIHEDLNNLVEVRGACYDATIRDCWGYYLKGTYIKLVTVDLNGIAYKPNGAEIINCELSNSWSSPGGSGIEIYSSNVDTTSSGAVSTIKIHNCWLEALSVGIYSEAKNTIISNNPLISAVDKGIHINNKYVNGTLVNQSGRGAQIVGNRIGVPQSTSYGVYFDGSTPYDHIILGNYFDYFKGTAIYCSYRQRIRVSANIFEFGASTAVGVSGTVYHSQILGNVFIGSASSPRGVGINADGTVVTIVGNEFEGLEYSMNAPSLSYVYEANNIYINNTNAPILGTKYKNSGTATITGDGATTVFYIPHGLVSTPNFVTVEPKAGAPKPDNVDADATNIILTFTTAPAAGTYYYWWKAEV